MTKEQFYPESMELYPEILTHRRWLHAHPETGFDTAQTKAYVKAALEDMGYAVSECGRSGLTACVGSGDKVLLLRADMDALPVAEETDLDFAAENGRMHACGHDMHTAMLLGAAKLLKKHEQELRCTVKLMFQSAEEIFEGAADMIHAGVLQNPDVDAALMIHVAAGIPIPAGTVIVSSPGVSAPAADYFSIRVNGKGCHGSAPQNGIDPLTAAAHILIALQEIQARELAASQEAVLTVGAFHSGNAGNVIPDSAAMEGTIRTYDEKTRNYLKDRIEQISVGIASAFRAKAEISFGSGCPALINNEKLSRFVTGAVKELLGCDRGFTTAELSPDGRPTRGGGSEDFAYISQEVPSVMLSLTAGEPDKGYAFSQHHPKVKFDESVLPIGSAVFAWCALCYPKKD